MNQKIVISCLFLSSLIAACVSVPPPTPGEVAVFQRAKADLVHGEYDWVIYDMENYLLKHPNDALSAQAYLILGDAYRGQVDKARTEKKISGLVLTSHTGPLMQKALDHYLEAAQTARDEGVASEAMYKSAVMLDIEYMKRFEMALAVYEKVLRKFPGTAWADKAKDRFENLGGKFRTLKDGPHDIPEM